MMTLAPGTGSCSMVEPSLLGPMHAIGGVTASSQPESNLCSSCRFEVYQEPACDGFLMIDLSAILRK